MASTPGRIRPWRHLAAFAGIVVVLYALVFFTGDKATPKLGIDLQGGTRVTLDSAHRVGRRAAARAAPAGAVDHRAARERPGRERRRGRPGRHQHHDHGAGRGGRPGPVARADGAASVPRGGRRPGGRDAGAAPHPTPATDAPNTDAPATDTPTGTTLPPQGAAGDAPVDTRDVAPVALAQPLPATPPPTPPPATPGAAPPRPRPTRPWPPRSTRPARRARARTRPCRPRPCRRSTARPPIRCAATTTRRCRWSAATRTAPRSTCSARASWRAPRSRPRRPRRTARAPAGSST